MSRRNNPQKPRIYIGNKEIAGYFMHLKEGFSRIGIQADLWLLVGSHFYDVPTPRLAGINQKLFQFYYKNKKSHLLPITLPAIVGMAIIHTTIFLYSLIRYDVFILNSQPFFNFIELAILRFFRKKIIVVFLGTESRPAYLSGNNIHSKYTDADDSFRLKQCYQETKAQAKRIARIEKYADLIINHPPSALFHRKPFIAWLHIGFPNSFPSQLANTSPKFSRVVKILHAPSNPLAKGSNTIQEIITKLWAEGLPIEYLKLENVPNHEVIKELRKCDIVVDELYSDIPIGGLGTEAAFACKPVINGGYYSELIHSDYPNAVIPPARFCNPEQISMTIRDMVINKETRKQSAQELNQFVVLNWNSEQVAKRFLQLIEGTYPSEWMYDPGKIEYFKGYGIEKNKLRSFVRQYVMRYGKDALFLNDKPNLLVQISNFITS